MSDVQYVIGKNQQQQQQHGDDESGGRGSRSSSVSVESSTGRDFEVEDSIQCNFLKDEKVTEGKWLRINRVTYEDPSGKERAWESVCRAPRSGIVNECVAIIAIYQRLLHYDQVVLLKQYRPALRTYTVEMPCAMVSPGDSVAAIALREIKEETGFVGELKHIGPLLSLDSTISEGTMKLATMIINGDSVENYNSCPTRHEGKSGFVDMIMVPLQELLQKLNDFSSQGYIVDSRVHAFAVGMSMGSKPLRKRSRIEANFGVPEGLDRLNNDMPV